MCARPSAPHWSTKRCVATNCLQLFCTATRRLGSQEPASKRLLWHLPCRFAYGICRHLDSLERRWIDRHLGLGLQTGCLTLSRTSRFLIMDDAEFTIQNVTLGLITFSRLPVPIISIVSDMEYSYENERCDVNGRTRIIGCCLKCP